MKSDRITTSGKTKYRMLRPNQGRCVNGRINVQKENVSVRIARNGGDKAPWKKCSCLILV
jgi:hypothetical protein